MPELTRRRSTDAQQECWHVYYGDVRVGTISERSGVPHDVDQWGWNCGFYPLSHRGRQAGGTAATFDEARADFEAAWKVYLARCAEPTSMNIDGRRHGRLGSMQCMTPALSCRRNLPILDRGAFAVPPSTPQAWRNTLTPPT
jgi:hypothetical protein